MSQNLKARLQRVRSISKPSREGREMYTQEKSDWPGWVDAGFKTLKREFRAELRYPLPSAFPEAMPILVPDFLRLGRLPSPEELLFFDLETTGLSGGAGTIAFLAAFGRFDIHAAEGNASLVITQYLLLDYPGEADFIERLVSAIISPNANSMPGASSRPPLIVSFNGKSFDSQILRNRCLMNRINPPEYNHADLLHPARRLWKRQLSDCSQATIEVSVLGLDRTGDISGVMAPDIWFSFLRNGDNRELLSICEHNTKDIIGLASLFLALAEIAEFPFQTWSRFRFNMEALAISWWRTLKKHQDFFQDNESRQRYAKAGESLLETAAQSGSIPAAVILAKNAEWQLGDVKLALRYTKLALTNQNATGNLREELERRNARLEKKQYIVSLEKRETSG